jgi:hypothetical protein
MLTEIMSSVPATHVDDIAQGSTVNVQEQQRVIGFHDPIKDINSCTVAGATHSSDAAPLLGERTDELLTEIGYSSVRSLICTGGRDWMFDHETEGTLWQACRRNRAIDS